MAVYNPPPQETNRPIKPTPAPPKINIYNGHSSSCLCCMCQQLCQDQGRREIPGVKKTTMVKRKDDGGKITL